MNSLSFQKYYYLHKYRQRRTPRVKLWRRNNTELTKNTYKNKEVLLHSRVYRTSGQTHETRLPHGSGGLRAAAWRSAATRSGRAAPTGRQLPGQGRGAARRSPVTGGGPGPPVTSAGSASRPFLRPRRRHLCPGKGLAARPPAAPTASRGRGASLGASPSPHAEPLGRFP